ncbi:MAG: hypothetical protein AAGM22_06520 [Acidobacteriota bacterium]
MAATLLAFGAGAPAAIADGPSLIVDLETTPTGSGPASFLEFEGQTYFSADRGDVGREIFVSDGTAAGTRLFVDAYPGPTSSAQNFGTTPRGMLAAEGRFFFIAEGPGAIQLWVADADGAAAIELAGDDPPRVDSILGFLNGRLFFAAATDAAGEELWSTDGTAAGTELVKDLAPGPAFGNPEPFTFFGAHAYFSAGTSGEREIWRTDGTAEGTVRITDFASSDSRLFCNSSTERFLSASAAGVIFAVRRQDPVTGFSCDAWVSDGSQGGARPLLDADGNQAQGPRAAMEFGDGRVFYGAGIELWVTDGTDAGTLRLLESGRDLFSDTFARAGDRLLFAGEDGEALVPWVSDGTPEGTRPVGLAGTVPLAPHDFVSFGDRAVFTGTTGATGRELYVSDGTFDGTRLLADIRAGEESSTPTFWAVGDRLWFAANDGLVGPEPWVSDGTPEGTRLLVDLDTDGTGSSAIEGPIRTAAGVGIFDFSFGGDPLDSSRDRLWVTDGTADGTGPMADPQGGELSRVLNLTEDGDRFYFTAESPDFGIELLRFDGAGPPRLFDLQPGASSSAPSNLTPVGDLLFFTREMGGDLELWRLNLNGSDATFLAELRPFDIIGAGQSAKGPYGLANFERTVAFGDSLAIFVTADLDADGRLDPDDRESLWISDGTPAGTEERREVSVIKSERPNYAVVGEALVYLSEVEAGRFELWRADARADTLLAEFTETGESGGPDFLVAHRGRAYFGFLREDLCYDLWATDGTAAGTREVPVPCGARPRSFGGQLYITPQRDGLGVELWRLLGDPLRAELVSDVRPGPDSSIPFLVADSPGVAYFRATTDELGTELWRTDGTTEGTRAVGDIAPGPNGSGLSSATFTGRELLFVASDGVRGGELWKAPLSCVATGETLCLGDGRFQVRARWRDVAGSFGEGLAKTRPLTDDSGTFWFFDPANTELAVKVLDGRALTGAYWVFFASLSDVEFEIEVLDTVTGEVARYFNEAGTLASVGDTAALPAPPGPAGDGLGASGSGAAEAEFAAALAPTSRNPSKMTCLPSDEVLCLGDGRFAVTATWRDFEGKTGVGGAGTLGDDTGTFWFFDRANVEMLIKILDGRELNGRFWVFYGALSNVAFEITVTDLETGAVKTYRNPEGTFASVADTDAF